MRRGVFGLAVLSLLCITSSAQPSPHYTYTTIAKPGDAMLVGMDAAVSVNDSGKVAFVGQFTASTTSFESVFMGDGLGAPVNIGFAGTGSSTRDFSRAQITNGYQVLSRERVSGSPPGFVLRSWDGHNPGSGTIIASTVSHPQFSSVLSSASINNANQVAFIALNASSQTELVTLAGASLFNRLVLPDASPGIPMLADNGYLVIRAGSNTNPPIRVYDYGLGSFATIADAAAGFTTLGRNPAISDDGQIIVFAGDRGQGPGIYLTYSTGPGTFSAPSLVAGGNSPQGSRELGMDPSQPDSSLHFSSFDLDARLGVLHTAFSPAGLNGDTVHVTFTATPNVASPARNWVKFTATKGIWVAHLTVDPTCTRPAHVHSIRPVIQIGDSVGGDAVTDLGLGDPIAGGIRTIGATPVSYHYVAFWANTSAGQKVVRASTQESFTADSDGDGLLDAFEFYGVSAPSNPCTYYPLLGGDPNHKDLFVEVDAMTGFLPKPGALDSVVAAFNRAPVVNPDGVQGIRLHILGRNGNTVCEPCIDETVVPAAWGAAQIDCTTGSCVSSGNCLPADFYSLKQQHFGMPTEQGDATLLKAKARAFRYCIFGQSFLNPCNGRNGNSGVAELPGNDFTVTLGGGTWAPASRDEQAGTFMHELGHTLGLTHTGESTEDANFKPNYASVMNYIWQNPVRIGTGPDAAARTLWHDSWRLDYSRSALNSLNESDLSEPAGIGGSAAEFGIRRVPVGPPGPSYNKKWMLATMSGPVNWDRASTPNNLHATADVNYLIGLSGPSPGQVLAGFNDWQSIQYLPNDQPHWTAGFPNALVAEDVESPRPAQSLAGGPWTEFDSSVMDSMSAATFDCNGNNVSDGVDIANGTSADFDHNGIPDECEYATAYVPDDDRATGPQWLRVYRNPVRAGVPVTIRFGLSSVAAVRVDVLDVLGRRVVTLADATMGSGSHELTWYGTTSRGTLLSAGMYIVRMSASGTVLTRRILVLR